MVEKKVKTPIDKTSNKPRTGLKPKYVLGRATPKVQK
jgi:hypothetical protein